LWPRRLVYIHLLQY